jgi:hypothetical protein
VSAAETKAAIVSQTCGNVLLAVCRHSETMEKLYSAMSPEEVDVSPHAYALEGKP